MAEVRRARDASLRTRAVNAELFWRFTVFTGGAFRACSMAFLRRAKYSLDEKGRRAWKVAKPEEVLACGQGVGDATDIIFILEKFYVRKHVTTAAFACQSEFVHRPTLGSLEGRLCELRPCCIGTPVLLLALLYEPNVVKPLSCQNSAARHTPHINRHIGL